MIDPSLGISLEFEKKVADELNRMGFPIFYRNVKIKYKKNNIIEFDIVSSNFIVEVKYGKQQKIYLSGLDFIIQHNMIPDGYTYYVYIPSKNNIELTELTELYNKPNIVFINTITEIRERHIPKKECTIKTQRIFTKFLELTMEEIIKFDTIYINDDIYSKTYNTLNYKRDSYSKIDNIRWSQKVDYLLKTNKLKILQSFDTNIPCIKTTSTPKSIHLHDIEPIKFQLSYNLYEMEKSRDMVDIYINK
jgi:hypothetical protein